MPSYLYERYEKSKVIEGDVYDVIMDNYMTSIFIMSIIEGMIVMMLFTQFFVSSSISIEITQGGSLPF